MVAQLLRRKLGGAEVFAQVCLCVTGIVKERTDSAGTLYRQVGQHSHFTLPPGGSHPETIREPLECAAVLKLKASTL